MYINRALLLVIAVILVFLPAIEEWMLNSQTAWYRPYQLWLLAIVAAYWNQRKRYPNDL